MFVRINSSFSWRSFRFIHFRSTRHAKIKDILSPPLPPSPPPRPSPAFFPSSLANSDPLFHSAVLALHDATPMKLAFAPLDPSLPHHVVTPSAAQVAAPVPTGAGLVASTPRGPRDVRARISLAKVWRFLVIKQLLGEISGPPLTPVPARPTAMFPLPLPIRPPPPRSSHSGQRGHAAQVALRHQHSVSKSVLERLPDYSEIRRHFPASLELAGTRHTVALASHLHVAGHRLKFHQSLSLVE